MNNTDFFNDHRADALKLIYDSVKGKNCEFYAVVTNDKCVLYSEMCAGEGNLTICEGEYSPCSDTTEGKERHLDLLKDLHNKLEETDHSDEYKWLTVYEAIKSPEAACIVYLDMIRKV